MSRVLRFTLRFTFLIDINSNFYRLHHLRLRRGILSMSDCSSSSNMTHCLVVMPHTLEPLQRRTGWHSKSLNTSSESLLAYICQDSWLAHFSSRLGLSYVEPNSSRLALKTDRQVKANRPVGHPSVRLASRSSPLVELLLLPSKATFSHQFPTCPLVPYRLAIRPLSLA